MGARNVRESSPKTWTGWYRTQLTNISSYAPLVNRKLGTITSEHVADYAAFLQTKEWQPSSINSSLRVLRRVLKLAVEWGMAPNAPKINLLRGERHREHVVSREEEEKYLVAANELLADIVAVLSDTGMRPEENARLRWESIRWHTGQCGTLQVTHGKTAAAKRMLPMSPRVRSIFEKRWHSAERPAEGWVWSSATKSGHIEASTLKKQHHNAIRESKVRPFVLYSLRHTFLTRLGESGCDAWTLARIAGHASIAMSARYVHPTSDNVARAFAMLNRVHALESQSAQHPN